MKRLIASTAAALCLSAGAVPAFATGSGCNPPPPPPPPCSCKHDNGKHLGQLKDHTNHRGGNHKSGGSDCDD